MLRAAQKLMYLYGFPEIDIKENNNHFDSETLNILIVCLGAMYGVVGANHAIKAMAKEVFSGFFKKAIPVVGGAIGGSITYISFKPCCEKLKDSLKDTFLTNPNHKETKDEDIILTDDFKIE